MKIYTCLCLLFLAGYLVAQNNTSALLPMPNQITPVKGKPFTVRSGKTAIYLNQPELQFTAKTLQTILQDRMQAKVPLASESGRADIRLLIDPAMKGKEHYRIEITSKGITISGATAGAVYYGVMTMDQLLLGDACATAHKEISPIRIDDAPRFPHRALMLDPARHFLPVNDVKFFIDQMARYKYNILQLHLTDDQGWRVEIKKHPKLVGKDYYTQEQLAEKFEVSARTVSRWETGINMPDLSILVQLAEYYDVEMRELLDGERSQTMNKEMKETLDKVAVYEEWVKQKALKAGNLAFASMFVISVLAIIIQMLLTVDIRLVLGETATALVGGILYASIMVYNGIWDKCLPKSATIWRDFLTSVICAGIFTVIYGICLFRMGATETQITRLALGFLIGITIVAFIILRLLAFINRKRNQNSLNVQEKKETSLSKVEWTKIYNAQNIVETEQLVEMLKQNGIAAFSQEAGANVAMHGAPGFGIYGVDIFVKTDDAEKAVQLIKEINNQE